MSYYWFYPDSTMGDDSLMRSTNHGENVTQNNHKVQNDGRVVNMLGSGANNFRYSENNQISNSNKYSNMISNIKSRFTMNLETNSDINSDKNLELDGVLSNSGHTGFHSAIMSFLPWINSIDQDIIPCITSNDELVFSKLKPSPNFHEKSGNQNTMSDKYNGTNHNMNQILNNEGIISNRHNKMVETHDNTTTSVYNNGNDVSLHPLNKSEIDIGNSQGLANQNNLQIINCTKCAIGKESSSNRSDESFYPYLNISQDLKLSPEALHALEALICPLKVSTQLKRKISFSIAIIITVLKRYERIGISFNGGKDSVVMMNLVSFSCYLLNLSMENKVNVREKVTVFHLKESNSFSELDSFIEEFKEKYILSEPGLTFETFQYVDMMKGIKGTNWDCIILGVRLSDYDDRTEEQKSLKILCPTTGNWPKMMRVHPILFWEYSDIWEYTHAVNLPFCSMYERGYTSIGKTINTRPNPYLKIQTGNESNVGNSYKPAWELKNGSLERAGRGIY